MVGAERRQENDDSIACDVGCTSGLDQFTAHGKMGLETKPYGAWTP